MKVFNKKAKFNYILFDKYEAGISLTGTEVKAFRKGSVDLNQSYGKVIDDEAYLINSNFAIDTGQTRSRKLLLHKNEIVAISTKIKAKKLTLVPTKMYTKGRKIKVEVALAKSKKRFEKKEQLMRRDIERDAERELRGDKDNINRKA
jgi:SsrA-binding protein